MSIRNIYDTAANLTSANPILGAGELGFESDTKKGKLGDGVTAWTSLPYTFGVQAWDVINSGTLAAVTTLDITSIPATYRGLELIWHFVPSASSAFSLTFNGDTSAVYDNAQLFMNNPTATGTDTQSQTSIPVPVGAEPTSARILLPNYAATGVVRTAIIQQARSVSSTDDRSYVTSGWWNNTAAAINRITLTMTTGTVTGPWTLIGLRG